MPRHHFLVVTLRDHACVTLLLGNRDCPPAAAACTTIIVVVIIVLFSILLVIVVSTVVSISEVWVEQERVKRALL